MIWRKLQNDPRNHTKQHEKAFVSFTDLTTPITSSGVSDLIHLILVATWEVANALLPIKQSRTGGLREMIEMRERRASVGYFEAMDTLLRFNAPLIL